MTSDGGNQAIIWNLETGEEVTQLSSWSRQLIFSTARFSDDGSLLVTGTPSGRVMVWDTQSGKRVDGFEVEPKKILALPARSCMMQPLIPSNV